jgi:Uma2 family endonuclease
MSIAAGALSLDEFLAWENVQPTRNEFHRGAVLPTGDMTRREAIVGNNMSMHLGNHLAASPCQVFAYSMKVQIGDDTILYPDVFVTCDSADLSTDMIFRSPLLVVEVVSPGSRAYDHGRKFDLYQRVASLREYVLIDPETRRVEAFRRTPDNQWLFDDMSAEPAVRLASIDQAIPLADVFDGIDPPA